MELAEQLYRALLLCGSCRCSYERNKAGVPLWFPVDGGGISRRLVQRCARCEAIELYETEKIIEGIPEILQREGDQEYVKRMIAGSTLAEPGDPL